MRALILNERDRTPEKKKGKEAGEVEKQSSEHKSGCYAGEPSCV
jgi:hypothetical protein